MYYEKRTDCPICEREIVVLIEPPEEYLGGMGGPHYPGSQDIVESCGCHDALANWTLERWEEQVIESALKGN